MINGFLEYLNWYNPKIPVIKSENNTINSVLSMYKLGNTLNENCVINAMDLVSKNVVKEIALPIIPAIKPMLLLANSAIEPITKM